MAKLFGFAPTVLKNLISKPVTKNYPAEPAVYPERSRGHIEIEVNNCVLCGLCMKNCPSGAITVDRAGKTWSINPFDCVQCGYCTTVCAKKALSIVPGYTTPDRQKSTKVFDIPFVPKAPARPAGAANPAAAKAAAARAAAAKAVAAGTAPAAANPAQTTAAANAAGPAASAAPAASVNAAGPAAASASTASNGSKTVFQIADEAMVKMNAAKAAGEKPQFTQEEIAAMREANQKRKLASQAEAKMKAAKEAGEKPQFTPEELAAMREVNLAKKAAATAANA